jgi:hypothetical protein
MGTPGQDSDDDRHNRGEKQRDKSGTDATSSIGHRLTEPVCD